MCLWSSKNIFKTVIQSFSIDRPTNICIHWFRPQNQSCVVKWWISQTDWDFETKTNAGSSLILISSILRVLSVMKGLKKSKFIALGSLYLKEHCCIHKPLINIEQTENIWKSLIIQTWVKSHISSKWNHENIQLFE